MSKLKHLLDLLGQKLSLGDSGLDLQLKKYIIVNFTGQLFIRIFYPKYVPSKIWYLSEYLWELEMLPEYALKKS